MKNFVGILIAVVVVFGAISYFGGEEKISGGPIRIGASISLTGSAAQFGEMSKLAMDMAVEEINDEGGINGRKVELYIEDDHTVPKDAVSAWRKLVDFDHVDAVIGGLFDFTAQPLFPLAQSEEIVFVSTNFAIKDKFEMNDYSFVMYPDFEKVINELDTVIADLEISQMGMLRFQSDFGGEIERVLKNILVSQERSTLVSEVYAQIGGSDFRTPIIKLKQAGVDTIFLDMLDFDIVTFLKRAHELNFSPQIIGYTTIRDVIGQSDLIEGAIMLDWEVPTDDFIQKFEAKYGIKPERGNNKSYDAIYVLAEAIADGGDVPAYLEKETFKTVNGKFDFTKDHSVENTSVKVMRVVGGDLVEIKSNI